MASNQNSASVNLGRSAADIAAAQRAARIADANASTQNRTVTVAELQRNR